MEILIKDGMYSISKAHNLVKLVSSYLECDIENADNIEGTRLVPVRVTNELKKVVEKF